MVKTQKKQSKLPKNIVGREAYIELILKNVEEAKVGRGKNYCVLGRSGVGKSLLLKSIPDLLYIDLAKIGRSPEEFAVDLVEAVSGKKLEELKDVNEIKTELQKIKPDQVKLVTLAFAYTEKAKIVCFDNFWQILDMNNFDQVSDIIGLIKSLGLKTKFLIAGSAFNLMNDINSKLGYEVVEITGLRLRDVGDEDVLHYTRGVPLYVNAVKSKMSSGYTAREAFLIETLLKSGVVYSHCKHMLEGSLARARGKALLHSILRVLSKGDFRLNEISRRVFRSASVTKNLLNRLIEVDLVVQDGNLFRFKDDILCYWFKNYCSGVEFDFVPEKAKLSKIEVDI